MGILNGKSDFEAIIEALESKMTPEVKSDYNKIVTAGLQYGLDKGRDGLLGSLRLSQDPVNACAIGAVNVVTKFLRAASRGTMPPVAMVYASKTLMYLALEFVDRAAIASIGTDQIVRAEHIWTNNIFKAFNISPQQLNHYAGQAKAVTQNPMQMEQIHRQTGYAKDPRASTPLEAPAVVNAPPPNRAARRRAGRK